MEVRLRSVSVDGVRKGVYLPRRRYRFRLMGHRHSPSLNANANETVSEILIVRAFRWNLRLYRTRHHHHHVLAHQLPLPRRMQGRPDISLFRKERTSNNTS